MNSEKQTENNISKSSSEEIRSKNLKVIASQNKATLFTLLTLVVILVLVGLAGFIFYTPNEEIYQGRVEVDELRVSGKVPGRITEFLVEEGDTVHQGDTLVQIYSPEVLAKEEQAIAADKAAEALRRTALRGGTTDIISTTYQAWIAAKAALEVGEKSFKRVERLNQEGVIPAQKYDETKAKLTALQSAEKAAKSQYDLAKKGLLDNNELSDALTDRTTGIIKEVDAYRKEAALISPIDGVISEIYPKKGELVGTGAPIMDIADMSSFFVYFTIREDHLSKVKVGKVFTGKIPALANQTISLKVVKLKDMGSYAVWKSAKPTGAPDVRSFEVTMKPLDTPRDLLPGMSVILDKDQI